MPLCTDEEEADEQPDEEPLANDHEAVVGLAQIQSEDVLKTLKKGDKLTLDYDDAGQCWEVAIKHAGKKFSIEDTDGTYMNTNHFNLRTTAFFVYWWSSEPRATALPPGCLTLEPEEGHTVTVTGGAGGT